LRSGKVADDQAEESMRRAESTRDPIEREDYLRESLRSASFYLLVLTRSLFSKASSSVPIPRLQDVSERYRSMQYTLGAIELPLRCAVELDPQDKARDYVRDGEHPSDPRKALYTARMECYACVIEALAMLDELLDRATESSSNSTSSRPTTANM
jgi:nuclear pore complex protein Nup155